MPSARKPTVLIVAGFAGVALAVAGCGGSSSPGVVHLSPGKGAASADSAGGGSTPESRASRQQMLVAYAKCMRANGVPSFPDPTAGGGGFHMSGGIDPSSAVFKAAQIKCRRLLPGGGPPGPGSTTHPSAQTLAHFLSVSQCMRRHGIPGFPDPRTSVPSNPLGSGIVEISDIEGVIFLFPRTIDQQSPAFKQAAAACAFPLHNH